VFPCRPRDKRPLLKNWPSQATTAAQEIVQWWLRWPTANLAIATGPTSNLLVLDVDQHEVDGEMMLAELAARHGLLPTTVVQRTGGGGRQLFFRWPDGHDIRNSVGRLGPGLDIRAEGGYAIVPPSVHPSGRRYRWECCATLAVAPPWLLDLLDPPKSPQSPPPIRCDRSLAASRYAETALRRELEAVRTAAPGTRNHVLNRAAYCLGQLTGAGLLDPEPTIRLLAGAAFAVGLTNHEVTATLRSGFEAGHRRPREVRT
jgi:Bifunctional DNA primase/polymerase, N-terminal